MKYFLLTCTCILSFNDLWWVSGEWKSTESLWLFKLFFQSCLWCSKACVPQTASQLRKCPYKIQLQGIILISDWWKRVQPIVGGVIPGMRKLRKQVEQVMGSKPISRILLWLQLQFLSPASCFEFLFWLPLKMYRNMKVYHEISPFIYNFLLVMVFITTLETKLRQCMCLHIHFFSLLVYFAH